LPGAAGADEGDDPPGHGADGLDGDPPRQRGRHQRAQLGAGLGERQDVGDGLLEDAVGQRGVEAAGHERVAQGAGLLGPAGELGARRRGCRGDEVGAEGLGGANRSGVGSAGTASVT
jgi:hypothetical protein